MPDQPSASGTSAPASAPAVLPERTPAPFDICLSGAEEFHTFAPVTQAMEKQATLPCVGCGWCCLDHVCDEAVYLHGFTYPCPELLWSEEQGRYLCNLAADSVRGKSFRDNLRMGQGCCAPHNTWRNDLKPR
ncbi:hypothetical protein [Oleidesulfovibrio sp.]|uniref:hypothetical protein n=1 Tax=Oleidesulfovibrio sp. TaxID=2909707 RepID=UPI003A8B5521